MSVIKRVEQFTHSEKNRQTSGECWIMVNLGMLRRMSVQLPSGECEWSVEKSQAFAVFAPRNSSCDFEYGSGRDNWVVKLKGDSITESEGGLVHLKWDGIDETFPAFHPLHPAQSERCRDLLIRILQEYHSPEKQTETLLSLALSSLLDCILNPPLPIELQHPEEALRKLIIADRRFEKTLSQLSHQCGYSSDHIRRLFEARFGMTPKSFRTEYRMGIAQSLLHQGLASVKVSKQLGFSSPAHFSSAFRKHFGHSPGSVK